VVNLAAVAQLTIEELERWVEFGAKWRAIQTSDELAVVDLCQCTGELVEQRETIDPEVIAYVRTHSGEEA
jgi:hypothetical protein